ncbi:MAG: LysE family transporter [archaeon]
MILESILLGVILAAVPGPTFFEIVRRTLTRGLKSGVLLCLGDFFSLVFILSLTFFGIQKFLVFESTKIILFLAGGLFLIFMGVYSLLNTKIPKEKIKDRNSFFVGFVITMTSPLAIAAWIFIAGTYLAKYPSKITALFSIFLMAVGGTIFFLSLSFITHFSKRKISEANILRISKFFGILLFFWGIYFLYNFLILL